MAHETPHVSASMVSSLLSRDSGSQICMYVKEKTKRRGKPLRFGLTYIHYIHYNNMVIWHDGITRGVNTIA